MSKRRQIVDYDDWLTTDPDAEADARECDNPCPECNGYGGWRCRVSGGMGSTRWHDCPECEGSGKAGCDKEAA